MMSSSMRKLALTIHVTVAVGWAGALAVFLAHAGVAVLTDNVDVARAANIAMGSAAWFVILPLAIATLATGIVQGLDDSLGPAAPLLGFGKADSYCFRNRRAASQARADQDAGRCRQA